MSGRRTLSIPSTPDKMRSIAGCYDLEDTIGEGHFGVVKRARHVFTGQRVAVKVIDKTKLYNRSDAKEAKEQLVQEVQCMKLVKHTNVVTLYQVIDTNAKLYLVLELGTGGDLYDFIQKKYPQGMKEVKDIEFAKKLFLQIVNAIKYCHELHIVHRDLKPENIVFFAQDLVKLTDFGLSANCRPGQKLQTLCGSLEYSAPEIFLGESYDGPAVDVWSMGVLLYMMLVARSPFVAGTENETLTNIMDEKYYTPDYIPPACKRLLKRMLVRDVHRRCTVSDILTCDWLSDVPLSKQMPLIAKIRDLSKEDKLVIVQQMEEGNVATKDSILKHLVEHPYSHISATYYILAEKFLRRKQAFNSSIRRKKASYQESGNSSSSDDDGFQRRAEYTSPSVQSPLPTVFEKRGAAETGVFRKKSVLDIIPSAPRVKQKDSHVAFLSDDATKDKWARPPKDVTNNDNNRSPIKAISPARDKVGGRMSLPIPELGESDMDTLSGADDSLANRTGSNLSNRLYQAKSIPSLKYPQSISNSNDSPGNSSEEDLNPVRDLIFRTDLIPSRDDINIRGSRRNRIPSENPIRRMSSGDITVHEEIPAPMRKEKKKKNYRNVFKLSHDPTLQNGREKKISDPRMELHLPGAIGTDPLRKQSRPLSTSNPGFEPMDSPIVIKVQSKTAPNELQHPSTPKSKSYPSALSSQRGSPCHMDRDIEYSTPSRGNGKEEYRIPGTTSDTLLSHTRHKHRIKCSLL